MSPFRRLPWLLALTLPFAAAVAAQDAAPADWRWLTDQPAQRTSAPDGLTDSTFTFVEMAPGWHVTMGPGGALFNPRYFAGGEFSIESRIFHFPNSTNAEYGLIAGGTGLEGQEPRYVAFVVRGDGDVAAWEVKGGQRRVLSDWRRAEAVLVGGGKDVVGNQLKLTVAGGEAIFRANGLEVLVLPLQDMKMEGQFGFRIGKGVNVHASTLTATMKLAPVPPRR